MTILAIALGGAAGSVLRYLIGGVVQRRMHAGFPYGTLVVNVIGCLVIGILLERFLNLEPAASARGFLIVGLCGGFTTFSAFSSETVALIAGGAHARAGIYVILSVSLCLLATAAGAAITRAVAR